MKTILRWLGYEVKKPSALLIHMAEFTHNSWIEDLQSSNRINDYSYKLWS